MWPRKDFKGQGHCSMVKGQIKVIPRCCTTAFKTFPENFIKIHPEVFELSVFKNYIDPEDPDSDPDHSQN